MSFGFHRFSDQGVKKEPERRESYDGWFTIKVLVCHVFFFSSSLSDFFPLALYIGAVLSAEEEDQKISPFFLLFLFRYSIDIPNLYVCRELKNQNDSVSLPTPPSINIPFR